MTENHVLLNKWIQENSLLTVKSKKQIRGQNTFRGRLLSYQSTKQTLLFYDDDLKEVFHFSLSEIKEISAKK
ncbi:hypothetical protein [Alkalihalobacillus trypoxylicola]|uniref:Uncharacterized protein n=1 Tax=Alkalihalobacillus trypoxylicola TaxID=519424 RepID=A0A162EDU1_9BACI|nr:hypothetical protein [Alkalihalobacillus trypoxylicola]KYG32346.1 hypothetical protein AZF04_06175 [Alkalihalobacillus trypoxylicola]